MSVLFVCLFVLLLLFVCFLFFCVCFVVVFLGETFYVAISIEGSGTPTTRPKKPALLFRVSMRLFFVFFFTILYYLLLFCF